MASDERYLARVQAALDDADLDYDAKDAVNLVGWSIKQGNNLPWWKYHRERIVEQEGGYRNIHTSVLALTIGLLMNHPEMNLADAAMQAGDEWRKDIRRQWDVGDGPISAPVSLEGKAEHMATMYGDANYANDFRDAILLKHAEPDEPIAPFDETQMTDPRLIMAWELANEKEREVLRLIADGITIQQASAHLGGSASLAPMRMLGLRRRLEQRGVRAKGAAV